MKFRHVRNILLLLIVVVLAYLYYPPFRLVTWVAVGRSPVCRLAEALQAPDNLRKQVEYKDEILNASKLLEEDPKGYELWQTPKARFWVPAGSRYVLPYNLAEQKRQIYGTGEYGPHAGDIALDCGGENRRGD